MTEMFRFVVAATPKSGGEWVKGLLSAISDSTLGNFQKIDSHVLAGLPSNVVITTRVLPNLSLVRDLDRNGFQTVTIRRHPFDLLINLLLSANVDLETNTYWVDSMLQIEKRLANVMPRHPMVLRYAASPRFKDLLAISSQWKNIDAVYSLTYEGLANNPQCEMGRIVEYNRLQILVPLAEIIERQKKRRVGQPLSANSTFTSATSGVWRRLIPAIQAERLASVLSSQMIGLGYQSDPDLSLTADEADINWYRFMAGEQIRPLTESLQNYQVQRQVIGAQVDTSLQELALRLDSINQLLNSSSTSTDLLVAELKHQQKEVLKMGATLRFGGLAWRRFSKAVLRLLGIRS